MLILKNAQMHELLGKYDRALEASNNYIDYFPQDTFALYLNAKYNRLNGRYVDALETLTNLLENHPGSSRFFKERGNTYYDMELLRESIKDFSMAMDLNPSDAEIYVQRGMARLKRGDLKGACSDWKKGTMRGSNEAKKKMLIYCQ